MDTIIKNIFFQITNEYEQNKIGFFHSPIYLFKYKGYFEPYFFEASIINMFHFLFISFTVLLEYLFYLKCKNINYLYNMDRYFKNTDFPFHVSQSNLIMLLAIVIFAMFIFLELLHRQLNYDTEKRINLSELGNKVFNNNIPNTDQLIMLKNYIIQQNKKNTFNRNILISVLLFPFIYCISPIISKMFDVYIQHHSLRVVFYDFWIITIVILALYWVVINLFIESQGLMAQIGQLFIKDRQQVQRSLSLLEYLIYENSREINE